MILLLLLFYIPSFLTHFTSAVLVIRVTNDFVNILLTISEEDDGDESQENHHEKIKNMVKKYQLASKKMTKELRNVPEYPSQFGVHSAANAINAGISTEEEIQQYWMQGNKKGINDTLNDSTTICSFSQFNQYWILQAYGNMMDGIGMEYALKSIDLCWSPMMKLSTGGCFWEISSPEWLRFMNEGVSLSTSGSISIQNSGSSYTDHYFLLQQYFILSLLSYW